jgi:hypothetical protein
MTRYNPSTGAAVTGIVPDRGVDGMRNAIGSMRSMIMGSALQERNSRSQTRSPLIVRGDTSEYQEGDFSFSD